METLKYTREQFIRLYRAFSDAVQVDLLYRDETTPKRRNLAEVLADLTYYNNSHGVYFSKMTLVLRPLSDLTIEECKVIAGMENVRVSEVEDYLQANGIKHDLNMDTAMYLVSRGIDFMDMRFYGWAVYEGEGGTK